MHQPRRLGLAALGLAAGLEGCVLLNHRVGLVGSTVQCLDGFRLAPLAGMWGLGTVAVADLGYLTVYVHQAWTLRTRL